MISSGLFVLPGLAYAIAGPAVVFSYALAALLIIPVMMSKAELATAMPKSGGSYFYVERSLGPLWGTFAGLADWLSLALKTSFSLVGIGALGCLLLPQLGPWAMKLFAVAACLFFTVVNLIGTRGTGRLQSFLLIALLLSLGIFIAGSAPFVEPMRFKPFAPAGWRSVFAVAGWVFVSYGGLTKVASISEEIKNPARNLPLGMFIAFGVVSVLYVLVVFIAVGVTEGSDLSGSLSPIALGARQTMGQWGILLIDFGALLAFSTTANSGILAASRSPMAMSRDGLMPGCFAKTNRRFGTPHLSILLTSAFCFTVIVSLSVEDLVKTASTMMLVMYSLDNFCVIIMRQSGIQNYRPAFKSPGYPWIQIAAIVFYGLLIAGMGRVPLLLTGGFALSTAMWYLVYLGPRIDRESAFVFMVKSVISRDIERSGLEEELKQITLERDEIDMDRFDHLVKEAEVLDLEGAIAARDLFRHAARRLAPRLKMEEERVYELLLKREMETSTRSNPDWPFRHYCSRENVSICFWCDAGRRGFSDLHLRCMWPLCWRARWTSGIIIYAR
jgi:amino acid transporter